MFVLVWICFKGDMTRYLVMSMNLGIWNIKHDFIQVTPGSRSLIAFIRTYKEIKCRARFNYKGL